MSENDKKYPVVSKEFMESLFTSDDGWTTIYEGPSIRMTKTVTLEKPLEYVETTLVVPNDPLICGSKGSPIDPNKDYQIKVPDGDGLVGSDSIRAGIDAEILEKMEREALAAEDAAIVDDLMRQVKAGYVMPQVYVPLQVSHIFKKEGNDQ